MSWCLQAGSWSDLVTLTCWSLNFRETGVPCRRRIGPGGRCLMFTGR